jgi:hypothetical protein
MNAACRLPIGYQVDMIRVHLNGDEFQSPCPGHSERASAESLLKVVMKPTQSHATFACALVLEFQSSVWHSSAFFLALVSRIRSRDEVR